MKRLNVAFVVLVAALAGCSNDPETQPIALTQGEESRWTQPPMISSVERQGGALLVRGVAGPGARVVLRGTNRDGAAVSADGDGRFEVRLSGLDGNVILTPEVQLGEDAAMSPSQLVIIQGGMGPIVLATPGAATERLDGRGVLDAVDGDGTALIASGRAPAGELTVRVAGVEVPVSSGHGRWQATASTSEAATIEVGGQSFAYPGMGALTDEPMTVDRAGAGWRLTWAVRGKGRQSAWLPDR